MPYILETDSSLFPKGTSNINTSSLAVSLAQNLIGCQAFFRWEKIDKSFWERLVSLSCGDEGYRFLVFSQKCRGDRTGVLVPPMAFLVFLTFFDENKTGICSERTLGASNILGKHSDVAQGYQGSPNYSSHKYSA